MSSVSQRSILLVHELVLLDIVISFRSGDRLMTDIVFANQYGMKSVLVEPLTYVRDHPAAVVIR